MKVSLKWLREFLDFKVEGERVASLLNSRTMEVEKVFSLYSHKKSFVNVVVGEVKNLGIHPDNDKFGIADVYGGEVVGNKRIVFTREGLDIKVGEKPLIATKGTVFENGLKIRDKSIFGIFSEAAFCSEKDLGLQLNEPSIMKFPGEPAGRTAYDIFELDDTVLEFDLEPNRPDLFGIMGFAYELSAILGKNIILPEKSEDIVFNYGRSFFSDEKKLTLDIDGDAAPSYIAVKITGARVKESPMEIKNKLMKSGIRPINNIVDLTNIVMLETAQPLHAFDAQKVNGGVIRVRKTAGGETAVTLDGKERKLGEGDIVIEDGRSIIAIAGIMGGINSEIGKDTTEIIVESANFNMSNIRRTSRTLSLRTDASTRFEKGLHPLLSVDGIKRFLHLLHKYEGNFNVDCYAYDIKEPEKQKSFQIGDKDLCGFFGDDSISGKAASILARLGYAVSLPPDGLPEGGAGNFFVAAPPYFRSDISEPVNIYEDVFRIYGYDNVKSTMPAGLLMPPQKNLNFENFRFFKNLLRHAGFTEIISPSLTGEKEISVSGTPEDQVLELKNPVSADYAFFRTSIIPELLKAVSQNVKKRKNIKIYEAGKIYLGVQTDSSPVSERNFLCGAVCNGLKSDGNEPEFYYGKGIVEFMLKEAGIKKISYNPVEVDPLFNADVALSISAGGSMLGSFGEIKRQILEDFKINSRVFAFNLDIDAIKNIVSPRKTFVQPNKYPEIEQDISIIADADTAYAKIEKFIKGFSGLIKNIRLADMYKGKQIEPGKISFLIRYDLASSERTLTMEEVNSLRENLIKELADRFKISLRG